MKALLFTTHLNTGGIAVYTVNLARYLKRNGINVSVVSSGGELEKKLMDNGIPHITMDIKTKFEFGLKAWKAVPRLAALIKEKNIDLVHAQTRVAQVIGCLAARKAGVPVVTTCHGFFRHDRIGRILFPCWGDETIAISESVRGHLLNDFNVPEKRTTMIYNGIEPEHYSSIPPGTAAASPELKKRIGVKDNMLLVGSVGRLSSVKGYKYLIEGFAGALKAYDRMQLLIVGEGPEKDTLTEQALASGIEDKVFFASGKEASLKEFFAIMDIFCLSSLSEGLGLSLMEAMAAGRACIASDTGGLSELITHQKSGMLVPPADTGSLKRGILRLAKDKELRGKLGNNAREAAVNYFSIEKSVNRTIEVYRKAIAGAKR